MNGPSPLKVSPKPAAVTAATSVLKFSFPEATSTMFGNTTSVVAVASITDSSAISVSAFLPQEATTKPKIANAANVLTNFIIIIFICYYSKIQINCIV